MSATTFSPLEAVRGLEAAGVERKQAEAHAEALRQAATARHSRGSGNRDEFATKADLAGLEARMYRAAHVPCLVDSGRSHHRHPDRASVPAALTMRPEYDFSQGKRDVAAGERQRRSVQAPPGPAPNHAAA